MNQRYVQNQKYFNSEYNQKRDTVLNADAVVVPLDEKTKELANKMYDGSLALSIKNNTKYAMTGAAAGLIIGFIIASFTKGSKLVYGLAGAAVFGAGGYLMAPNDKKLV